MTIHAKWLALHERAHAAGMAAGTGHAPMPMVVGTPRDLMGSLTGGDGGGFDPGKPTYFVSDGVCGFAYVTITPGTSSYARWARKNLNAFAAYYGGTQFSVHEFGQSYERKVAYASAYCAVLREAGVECRVESRLD
jgi:hypothetical protein